jgi:demethylmenaquinone methyltransferase/2-methoxy-6-polyprenyl-1,4-benzoquinol methylase
MSIVLPDSDHKPAYVREMFTRIAARYDLANDAMTLGHHRSWKAAIVRAVAPRPGERALDLATGTGDIAVRLARAVGPTGTVVGLDLTPAMLDVARARAGHITWQEGDMLSLPFADASFDVVTIGFGLRNTADVSRALAEAARVLAPGGRLASLDLAKPRRRWIAPFINAYSYGVVPTIGSWVGGDGDAYRYLPASNETFPTPDELAAKLGALGFVETRAKELMLGAAAIVSGCLPG